MLQTDEGSFMLTSLIDHLNKKNTDNFPDCIRTWRGKQPFNAHCVPKLGLSGSSFKLFDDQ